MQVAALWQSQPGGRTSQECFRGSLPGPAGGDSPHGASAQGLLNQRAEIRQGLGMLAQVWVCSWWAADDEMDGMIPMG